MDEMICRLDFLRNYPEEDVGGCIQGDSKLGDGLVTWRLRDGQGGSHKSPPTFL